VIYRFLILFSLIAVVVSCAHFRDERSAHVSCNPLGGGKGEDCLLPYPFSYFTRPDPKSETGLRVALPEEAMPRSRFGARFDVNRFNQHDGFSAVATLLAHFPKRISARSLSNATVLLLEYESLRAVPSIVELDANADPKDKQALIIQPTVKLKEKTRYIAVVQGVREAESENLIAPLSGFQRLRDRTIGNDTRLHALEGRYEEVFRKLKEKGIARENVQLTWDFKTGSEASLTNRLVQMRNQAQALDRSQIKVKDVAIQQHDLPHVWKKIKASLSVPSFLERGNGNRLKFDYEARPRVDRLTEFPLTIHVPECAKKASGPLPVMLYGHGTFNSAEREMATSYSTEMLERLCMIEVGTDWLGRAKDDLQYFLFRVIPNWSNFLQITDRLQQAHVNFSELARLVHEGALDRLDELKFEGRALADKTKIYYYGISEGGCQGVTTLALSPHISRGALNVPCGFWSMFFWRSSDFYHVRKALNFSYSSALDHQKLLTLSQLEWDYTDPANYAGHLLQDPLPGSTTKQVLYQEGINDASVPNLTTRAMVRALRLKMLGPRIEAVDGVEEENAPALASAYVQYDVGARPRLGQNNRPPQVTRVHEHIRKLEAAKEQVQRFLKKDGMVENTCDGKPCSFNEL